MKKQIIGIMAAFVFTATAHAADPAPKTSHCADTDKLCKQFESLTEAQQPEQIVGQYESARTAAYSEDARRYIGSAYLALASRDNISPVQEEGYYRKALELNHYIAYMGLYFFHVQQDEEKALGFLKEYVKTKPADTVPYVILGESELNKKHYELADRYLQEAKKVAHAHSPRVDWMLFQTNYLLKNYAFAKEMFESAVTKGKFDNELKAISMDPRFEGIGSRPEFKQYQHLLTVAKACP